MPKYKSADRIDNVYLPMTLGQSLKVAGAEYHKHFLGLPLDEKGQALLSLRKALWKCKAHIKELRKRVSYLSDHSH